VSRDHQNRAPRPGFWWVSIRSKVGRRRRRVGEARVSPARNGARNMARKGGFLTGSRGKVKSRRSELFWHGGFEGRQLLRFAQRASAEDRNSKADSGDTPGATGVEARSSARTRRKREWKEKKKRHKGGVGGTNQSGGDLGGGPGEKNVRREGD